MGPAYLDLPGDVLYARVNEEDVVWMQPAKTHHRVQGDPGLVQETVNMLARAQRPSSSVAAASCGRKLRRSWSNWSTKRAFPFSPRRKVVV
jgi:thiamine pyrophosphate-dependent acetolactate synthase large subunit-like protein